MGQNKITIPVQTGRDLSLDILKGIAILCIMLMHYEEGVFPRSACVWIGSFMVNAFYFVSGWVQGGKEELTWGAFLKKRWQSLGKPYLWCSLLLVGWSILFWCIGHYELRIVLRDIYKTVTLRGIGTLWFLPALFGGECLALAFRKSRLPGRVLLCVATLLFLRFYAVWDAKFGHLNDLWRVLDSPLRVGWNVCNAWFSVLGGYYLGKYWKGEIAELHWGKRLGLTVLVLVWYSLNLRGYAHGTGCLTCLLGPLGVFLVCTCLTPLRCFGWLAYWGRNSLIVMVTHYSILQELCIWANRRWGTGTDSLFGWSALGYFALSVLLEIPVIWIMKRYFPWILGKSAVPRNGKG